MRNPSGNGKTTKSCTSKPPNWITTVDAGSGTVLVVEVLDVLPLVGDLGGAKNGGVRVPVVALPASAVANDRELGVVLPAAGEKVLELLLLLLSAELVEGGVTGSEAVLLLELDEDILSLRAGIAK